MTSSVSPKQEERKSQNTIARRDPFSREINVSESAGREKRASECVPRLSCVPDKGVRCAESLSKGGWR